jgi:hypothetical protein
VATRDVLDAMSAMAAAAEAIDAVLAAATDARGEIDPLLVDVEQVDRYRDQFRVALDYFEKSYRNRAG